MPSGLARTRRATSLPPIPARRGASSTAPGRRASRRARLGPPAAMPWRSRASVRFRLPSYVIALRLGFPPSCRADARDQRPRPMRKPANLVYGVEEAPPRLVTLISAIQHVGVIAIFMIYPLIIGREAGVSSDV